MWGGERVGGGGGGPAEADIRVDTCTHTRERDGCVCLGRLGSRSELVSVRDVLQVSAPPAPAELLGIGD